MLAKNESDLVFSFDAEVMPEKSGRVELQQFELSFCTSLTRLPLSAYCQFEEIVYNLPLWAKIRLGLKSLDKIPVSKRSDDLYPANWDAARWRDYARLLLSMLDTVYTGAPAILETLRSYEYTYAADVRFIENIFVDVYTMLHSGEPQEVEYFEHKGRKYRVPADPNTARDYLTWLEASTALQSDWAHSKIMSAKTAPAGEILRNSSAIIAALARDVRINPKTKIAQTLPVAKDPKKAEADFMRRFAAFQDLPASVAVDVGFFLTVSIHRSNLTLSLALPLSLMSQPAIARGEQLEASPQAI